MKERRNSEEREKNAIGEKIDGEFLDENSMIRRAFARAKIDTYPKLYEKAKAEYNLYYVSGLSVKLIKKIQRHLLGTGRKGIPNYEGNLKERPKTARKKTRHEKILRERLGLVKKQTRLLDM